MRHNNIHIYLLLVISLVACQSYLNSRLEQDFGSIITFLKDSIEIEDTFLIEYNSNPTTGMGDVSYGPPVILLKPKYQLDFGNYFHYKCNTINFKFSSSDMVYYSEMRKFGIVPDSFELKIRSNGIPFSLSTKHKDILLKKKLKLKCYLFGKQKTRLLNPLTEEVVWNDIIYYLVVKVY